MAETYEILSATQINMVGANGILTDGVTVTFTAANGRIMGSAAVPRKPGWQDAITAKVTERVADATALLKDAHVESVVFSQQFGPSGNLEDVVQLTYDADDGSIGGSVSAPVQDAGWSKALKRQYEAELADMRALLG